MKEKNIKKLSWEDIEKTIQQLGEKIKASGFNPDQLVGITVGGLIPLALLAKELRINRIVTVSASSYEKDRQGKLEILYMPEINLTDKKVLLIDEISETGETLKKISQAMLEKYRVSELKTAAIVIRRGKSNFSPDFFALEETGWVVFPWEKKEFPEYF